jgi:hypothetical protein
MWKTIRTALWGLFAITFGITAAQEATCPNIVSEALTMVQEVCREIGRNQACYGNLRLTAEGQPNAENFVFEQTGDIVNAADILRLDLTPLDEASGDWGVVIMALQVNLPNTLPGQNVTFILFGDVELENAATTAQSPLQAFYLRTGIGAPACEEAPESGLLVQTPEGVEEVLFNINGVDVSLGSTVLFQTDPTTEIMKWW